MASLKNIIKDNHDTINDGIAWFVLYKEGRSWQAEYFYNEDGSYDEGLVFDKDDLARMREISSKDVNAVCINGYYMGFGEGLSAKDTEDRLYWMYENHLNLLKQDFLDGFCVS